jgi:hypothetical protein
LDHSAAPAQDAQPFRLEPYALLQQGLELHWSADRFLADLEPRLQLYPVATRRFAQIAQRLRSDDAVEALVEALDGRRSFWKALQSARLARRMARDPPAPAGVTRPRSPRRPRARAAPLGWKSTPPTTPSRERSRRRSRA